MCFTQFSPMLHHRMFLLQATLKLMVKYSVKKFCLGFGSNRTKFMNFPVRSGKKTKPHRHRFFGTAPQLLGTTEILYGLNHNNKV